MCLVFPELGAPSSIRSSRGFSFPLETPANVPAPSAIQQASLLYRAASLVQRASALCGGSIATPPAPWADEFSLTGKSAWAVSGQYGLLFQPPPFPPLPNARPIPPPTIYPCLAGFSIPLPTPHRLPTKAPLVIWPYRQ